MNTSEKNASYKRLEDVPITFGPLELAKIMGISKNKAYNLANSPGFPKIKVGKRTVISKTHFLAWLDNMMKMAEDSS
jgi:hypothetical protein